MLYKLALLAIALVSFTQLCAGNPVNVETGLRAGLITDEELDHWIATTDAELTLVGGGDRSDGQVDVQVIRVVYCSTRANNVCGGKCTVYEGGSACLSAPDTQCLSATGNVSFCDGDGCGGSCSSYNTCFTRLENGFCATPGTSSILVPFT